MRYIATAAGALPRGRVRKGEYFDGPDGMEGSWFAAAPEEVPEAPAEKKPKKPAAKKDGSDPPQEGKAKASGEAA